MKGVATLVDPTTGEFTYTPNQQVSQGQIPTGTDVVMFTVTDGEATISGDHTIIIDPRIMPLGDSITEGVETNLGPPPAPIQPAENQRIGYRLRLRQLLAEGNYLTDFVGSRQYGTVIAALDDPDNEGHGGFEVQHLAFGDDADPALNNPDEFDYDGVQVALDRNPADILLLHIGTNGTPNNANATEVLLDEIDAWESANQPVTVLLALIVDKDPLDPVVTQFNDAVFNMADSRISNDGDLLLIINQHDALIYPDDLQDRVHPTLSNDPGQPGGYGKMTQTWMDGLTLDAFVTPLSQAVDHFMTEVMARCP